MNPSPGLHISTEDTSVGDETGIALAEALWLNDVLRHFLWAAGRTRLTDLTGRTLAQAAQLGFIYFTLCSFALALLPVVPSCAV